MPTILVKWQLTHHSGVYHCNKAPISAFFRRRLYAYTDTHIHRKHACTPRQTSQNNDFKVGVEDVQPSAVLLPQEIPYGVLHAVEGGMMNVDLSHKGDDNQAEFKVHFLIRGPVRPILTDIWSKRMPPSPPLIVFRHFVFVYVRNEFHCPQQVVALQPWARTRTPTYLVLSRYVFNGRLGRSDVEHGVRAFSTQPFAHLIMKVQHQTTHVQDAATVQVRHKQGLFAGYA